MQKRLIIAALVAAIVLPMPVLADTANVNIYGTADVSVDTLSNGDIPGGSSGTRVTRVSSNTSKLGFKGEEDLGDGLKAIWQVESEIDMDGTAANGTAANTLLGSRNTFGGLRNDTWGSLILGRYDTPYKTSDRRLDLFGDHVADNRALMGGGMGKGSADAKGFDKRATDTVVYNSPVINGFKATVGYVACAENATTTNLSKGSIWSLAGTADVAPFYGVLAYQENKYGTAGTGVVAVITGASANGASVDTKERAWKLGGGYKVDQFAINAVFEQTHDDFGGGPTANATCVGLAAGSSCFGHRAFYISGQYNITQNDAVKLAYTRADNLQDGNAVDTGAKHVSVGYDHMMSKRTKLYATYTKLTNDANAQYSLNGEGASTANVSALGKGVSPSAFSIGMLHTF